MVLINILTRTGKRESYFKTLATSIDSQTYKNFRHIKSNDNPECTFLTNLPDVFEVYPDRNAGNGFYNLYLNHLAKQVQEGWVIILDDDSKLIDKTFLEKLAVVCGNSEPNEILIYRSRISETGVIPRPENMQRQIFEYGDIDMACFCIHSTVLSKFSFHAKRGGDFNLLDQIRSTNQYTFKFVNLPIGISANYDGAKHGDL